MWLGRRARTPGPRNWQFPQGGIDDGEEPLQAARRELKEETGVTSVRLIGRIPDWLAYRFPPEHRRKKAARGWHGQKQLWFAFAFTGDESEIDLEAHGDEEFDAWRWADLGEAVKTIVPFKEETYRRVIEAFGALVSERFSVG